MRTPLTIEELELEEPRASEILVRNVATGVCHTDISMRDQLYPVPQPIVLGHEGAGVVEGVGSAVESVVPGDHVVMSMHSCGACPSCLDHQPGYCYDAFGRNFGGSRADGSSPISAGGERVHGNFFGQSSFATYSICHDDNVVKVRADVALELLGPLACGIQTGAGAIVNSLLVRPGMSVAVFGAGSVGLSAVMAARLCGAVTIVSVDKNPARLELARELGASHVVNAAGEDAVEKVIAVTGGGVDRSLEAVGSTEVLAQAIGALAPRGVCGVVGGVSPGSTVPLDVVHLMTGGRRVQGIVEGDATSKTFIPALIELHLAGRFPYDRLVSYYDFADINRAFEDSEAGRTVKAILRIGVG